MHWRGIFRSRHERNGVSIQVFDKFPNVYSTKNGQNSDICDKNRRSENFYSNKNKTPNKQTKQNELKKKTRKKNYEID